MSKIPIKDLPEGAYKQILIEAEQRGIKLTSPSFHPTSILLVGLADIIAELRMTKMSIPQDWDGPTYRG
jgi:hypothetical protein